MKWLASTHTLPQIAPLVKLHVLCKRSSLSKAYGATWDNVQESLKNLQARKGYKFILDDVKGTEAPETNSKDSTDAHLVALAKRHGLKLATLDLALIAKSWAAGVAENPLPRPAKIF
jgi:predicted nucleic acid-binding protein